MAGLPQNIEFMRDELGTLYYLTQLGERINVSLYKQGESPVTASVDPVTGVLKILGPDGKGDGLIAAGVPQAKYQRPPTPSDNASAGYSASSLWQYNGKVYKPAAAPSATSCAWVPQQRKGAYPVDIFGAAAKFAGGTVAMKAGFTGAAIDISVTVAGSPVAGTINIIASGELDTKTLEGYLSRMDAGSYCAVTKVYDQTGNGNHLVKHASYAALLLDFDALIGRYVITSEYVLGGVDRRLQIPASLATARNSSHMLFIGRSYNSAGNSNGNVFAVFGDWNGGANQISPLQLQDIGGLFIPQNPQGQNLTPASVVPVQSGLTIFGVSAGASTTDFFAGEAYSTAATNRTDALTGGWIGSDGASQHFFPGRVVGISLGSAVTSAQISTVVEGFYAQYNAVPQAVDQVVLIGDSRFSGAFAELSNTFSVQLPSFLKSKARVINLSNGSKQVSDMISGTAVTAQGLYKSGAKSVAVVLAGVNDFIMASKTVAEVLAELTTLVTMLKSSGYSVAVLSELATTSTAGGANVKTAQLAAALAFNSVGADRIIDTTVVPEIQAASNVTFYPDGLHPAAPIWTLLAGITAPVVDQLLN